LNSLISKAQHSFRRFSTEIIGKT